MTSTGYTALAESGQDRVIVARSASSTKEEDTAAAQGKTAKEHGAL